MGSQRVARDWATEQQQQYRRKDLTVSGGKEVQLPWWPGQRKEQPSAAQHMWKHRGPSEGRTGAGIGDVRILTPILTTLPANQVNQTHDLTLSSTTAMPNIITYAILNLSQCSVASVVLDSSQPYDCGPPGSSVHGILQARILEWVATSFSKGSFWTRDRTHVSYVSYTGRWVLPLVPPGKPVSFKKQKTNNETNFSKIFSIQPNT